MSLELPPDEEPLPEPLPDELPEPELEPELELELEPELELFLGSMVISIVVPETTEVPLAMLCALTWPSPTDAEPEPTVDLTTRPAASSVCFALLSLRPITFGTVTVVVALPEDTV